ncbi:MAG TPA: hypothetical protein VFU12_04080, partial [Glycomyces sp.]|nr:hypothetical protein [Glycomyces sp.]
MATVPDMNGPCGRERRLRAAVVAVAAVMSLTACTGPAEGTITDSPTPTSVESPTADLAFVLEIPADICPGAEIIPDELAAPESIGYEDRSGPDESTDYLDHQCTYLLKEEVSSVDGTQVIKDLAVKFAVTDGSPLSPYLDNSFSPVDFEEVEAAVYFSDWDQANVKHTPIYDPLGKELEESFSFVFELYASVDNLYINTH